MIKDKDLKTIQKQIIAALGHPEAEDGLYFNNLIVVHESEERPIVCGSDEAVSEALNELISRGLVVADETGESAIFRLVQR